MSRTIALLAEGDQFGVASINIALLTVARGSHRKEPTSKLVQAWRWVLIEEIAPDQDAINRHVYWTDPLLKALSMGPDKFRIIGVAPDIDDVHVVPEPVLTIYGKPGRRRVTRIVKQQAYPRRLTSLRSSH